MITLKESKVDKIWGVICVVFGLLMYFVIIPKQIKATDLFEWYNSARLMPNLYSILFVVCGIALFVTGMRKAKAGGAKDPDCVTFKKENMITLLVFIAVVALYIALLDILPVHYCIVTTVFLGFLMWFCGLRGSVKNYIILVAVAVILPILIYVGFSYGLHIRFM